MARVTLSKWIAQALTDPDKDKPCSALVCVHETAGGAEKPIHAVKISSESPRDPEDLAQLFRSKAEMHCQDLHGTQRCAILAYYGTKEEEARHAFLVKGYVESDGNVTESPDAKGAVAQTMRHLEHGMSMLMRQLGTVLDASNDQLRTLAKTNRELYAENADAIRIVKEVVLEREDRHQTMVLERMNHERSTNERELILRFLPTLVNTITGKEIFPVGTADTALVETLAKNITVEQAEKIAEHIPPAMLGPLMARLTEIQQQQTEVKKLKQHTSTLTDEFDKGAEDGNES